MNKKIERKTFIDKNNFEDCIYDIETKLELMGLTDLEKETVLKAILGKLVFKQQQAITSKMTSGFTRKLLGG